MPSQLASLTAGVPGVQPSCTAPLTQLVAPVRPQAPTPQLVATATYSSSATPSQSSSMPSHVVSPAAGEPGAQLSLTSPPRQLVVPARPQAPIPQLVGSEA